MEEVRRGLVKYTDTPKVIPGQEPPPEE